MCSQYPEIIITSPKEPAAFYAVPRTVQENLLTTNYEQWCALYSMDDDNISLAYVSSNLQKERKLKQYQNDLQYGEEYKYDYDDFEDDDFFDKYQSSRRITLDNEFNNYNNTHSRKYEYYNNRDYDDDNVYEEYDEGFDYKYDYESDEDYEDESVFRMEKEPVRSINRPRLNYDIIASAISRRFNKSTDSDVSDEEDENESENEDTIETKIVVKTPSIKTQMVTPLVVPKSHRDFFQKENYQNNEEGNKMFEFMETIKTKYGKKEITSSVPAKSGFSIINEVIPEGRTYGMPEAMSNKHGARNSLFTHRKSNSLQGGIIGKTLNENNFSSLIKKDCEMILNGPMKNRKRAFSLSMNNKNEFSDLKKNMLFCF